MSAATAVVSSEDLAQEDDDLALLDGIDDVDDISSFMSDSAVQSALSQGIDLRQYAQEVETALRSVERDSVHGTGMQTPALRS